MNKDENLKALSVMINAAKEAGKLSKNFQKNRNKMEVKFKGPVEHTILDLLGGIRSTCTYVNAHKLKDLSKCTTFVRVNNQVNSFYK